MKKLLLLIIGVVFSGGAIALPSMSALRAACNGISVNGVCMPQNACESSDSKYCDRRFDFFFPRKNSRDAHTVVAIYTNHALGEEIETLEYDANGRDVVMVSHKPGAADVKYYRVFEFAPARDYVGAKYFVCAVGVATGQSETCNYGPEYGGCWIAVSAENDVGRCQLRDDQNRTACEELQGYIIEAYGQEPMVTMENNVCKFQFDE